MMVRKTLQWIATLLFLAALGGGGYAYWFFAHTDEQLRAEVQRLLEQKLPNAHVTIQRAWFDFSRKVHLKTVGISAKGDQEPFARCDEIIFTLDGQELSEQQQIDLRAIRFVRPDVRLIRDVHGNWNWQKLLPLNHPDPACPEIVFDDLQVAIRIAREGADAIALLVQRVDGRLVPSSRHQFAVEASAQLPGLGDVRCDGAYDAHKKTWMVSGETSGTANITELLDSVASIVPDVRQRLAKFQNGLTAGPAGGREAAAANSPADQPAGEATLTGQAAIKFQLKQASAQSELAYRIVVSLSQGKIEHPILPFPLHGLSGMLDVDNHRLILKDVQAHNDVTHLAVSGHIDLPTPAPTNRVDVAIQDLAFDRRLEAKLPAFMRKNYNLLRPQGHVDATGALVCNEQGQWKLAGWIITHKGTSVLHREFPYPVTDIVGTVAQKANSMVINLRGRAGDRTVSMNGEIIRPGPEAEGNYLVKVDGLPIGDAAMLRAAAAHPPFQRTLTELKLQGPVDAECHFHRPPGLDRKMEWKLDVRLDHGSLEYSRFPYRIADLSGHVDFDSTKGRWKFSELYGAHGPALLSGRGAFVKTSHDDPGRLDLSIHGEHAPLENDLQSAFPPETQRLWELINPTGKLNVEVVLGWTPGQRPEIKVPEARITDGSFEIKTFPYSLEHVTARMALNHDPETNRDRVTIFQLDGQHDDTVVRINVGESTATEDSFVLCPSPDDPVGEWRLRLQRVLVEELVLDRTLRAALPLGLRKTVQMLNPQGRLSLKGMLDLRGTRRQTDPITAAWDIKTYLTGATINAGVELKQVNGLVDSYGQWDGTRLDMQGRVDLRSAFLWKHQFAEVHGPFKLRDQELFVGSEEVFRPLAAGERQRSIPNDERLTASAVGGMFFLDANLNAEKSTFHVKAEMRKGSLDQYARRYLNASTLLQGAMNGWVDLSGPTTSPNDVVGRGELLIDHAALYELPFFVQVFKAFKFAPVDKAAFYKALASFQIARRKFDFTRIDLIGDAFNLRGRGRATFDGALSLDFYSRPTWQIPIFRDLVEGWFGVRVTGTVWNPRTDSTSPQVDEFLKAFNPRTPLQLSPPPWMTSFPLMVNPRARSASAQPFSSPQR